MLALPLVLVALQASAGCSSGDAPRASTATIGAATQKPSTSPSRTSEAVADSSRNGRSIAQVGCDQTLLSLTVAGAEGSGTGQTAMLITLRNSGRSVCRLTGFPRLTALDAVGTVLPFRIRNGGGQSVTSRQPVAVLIRPGESAFVTFGKYRCDVGDKARVSGILVALPGAASHAQLDLSAVSQGMAFCGPGDPGSELQVSPVEPTELATRNLH